MGLTARKSYDRCWVGFMPDFGGTSEKIRIEVPGQTEFSFGYFEADYVKADQLSSIKLGRDCFILDDKTASLPLFVRTFRNGDRMSPNGMAGSQKIQRIFINEKVDRNQRMVWPMVTDAKDNVLWLPMLKRAMSLPSPQTSQKKFYLKLKFIPFVGFGRTQA
jgi:tRNA(Ile)-lysidine synthase